MAPRFLQRLFLRFPRAYPRVVLIVQFQVAHLVVLGGVGLLALYQPMSGVQVMVLVGAAWLLVAIENVSGTVVAFRLLRPVTRWLDDPDRRRDPHATREAWCAAVELPRTFLQRRALSPVAYSAIPWCLFAVLYLDLDWPSFLVLLAGSAVVILYGVTVRFLAMEIATRPIAERIAADLPDGLVPDARGIPIRWRLLLGLPIINVITGVLVAGLSQPGTTRLADLGLDVLVAVVVAFTISLELTILLSRTVLGPIGELRSATERVARGDYGVRVPVVTADETGALAQSFNSMVDGLEERERLREALGTFVDPEIADRVAREGLDLAGDELEVSVLFVDIRDFTAFAERSSAHEVVRALNDFFGRVVPIVARHGGHASKFLGDGLLAVFGAPERLADHADRAVAAGIEIVRAVGAAYGDGLRVGVGVNSGPVVVGTVGGGGRLDFTVVGDPVNTAARVEEHTRVTGDAMLVSEATRCLLTREHGGFEARGEAPLKGKQEPLALWAPRALAGDRAGAGAPTGTTGSS